MTQDATEAIKWYRKAADQGYAEAQNWLGDIYQDGIFVAQDDTEAAKWYLKAAQQGHEKALAKLEEIKNKKSGSSPQ